MINKTLCLRVIFLIVGLLVFTVSVPVFFQSEELISNGLPIRLEENQSLPLHIDGFGSSLVAYALNKNHALSFTPSSLPVRWCALMSQCVMRLHLQTGLDSCSIKVSIISPSGESASKSGIDLKKISQFVDVDIVLPQSGVELVKIEPMGEPNSLSLNEGDESSCQINIDTIRFSYKYSSHLQYVLLSFVSFLIVLLSFRDSASQSFIVRLCVGIVASYICLPFAINSKSNGLSYIKVPQESVWSLDILWPWGVYSNLSSTTLLIFTSISISLSWYFLYLELPIRIKRGVTCASIQLLFHILGWIYIPQMRDTLASLAIGLLWCVCIVRILILVVPGSEDLIITRENTLLKKITRRYRKYFVVIIFLVSIMLFSSVSFSVFQLRPFLVDTSIQYEYAKHLANGHLYAPFSTLPRLVPSAYAVQLNSGWIPIQPPFHLIILAMGWFFNLPWLVNPIVGALTIVIMYCCGKEMYGRHVGRISALFGMLSPSVILISSEYMNHATACFLSSCCLFFTIKYLKYNKNIHLLLFGVVTGMLLSTRPLSGIAIVLPLMIPVALKFFSSRVALAKKLCGIFMGIVGISPGILLLLYYNYISSGSLWISGYEVNYGRMHNPGFGISPHGINHTPQRAFLNTLATFVVFNRTLFWSLVPSLFILFLAARYKPLAREWLLLLPAIGIIVAYFFYWDASYYFGARFWYEAIPMWIILIARISTQSLPLLHTRSYSSTNKSKIFMALFIVTTLILGSVAEIPDMFSFYSKHYL